MWRDGDRQRKDLNESNRIDFPEHARNCKNGFDFGAKEESSVSKRVKKRPDAKPVAGKKKAFLLALPNSKRPLAIHVVDALLARLLLKAQKNLCVRLRLEPDPFFDQIILQFDVIENLS